MLTVLAHQAALQLQCAVVQEALARLQVCLKCHLWVTVPHLKIGFIKMSSLVSYQMLYCINKGVSGE